MRSMVSRVIVAVIVLAAIGKALAGDVGAKTPVEIWRAGDDALRLTAVPHLKAQRLRGLFMKVVEEGEVATGDEIQVLTRPS